MTVYRCMTCDQNFSSEWGLTSHDHAVHAVRRGPCDLCGARGARFDIDGNYLCKPCYDQALLDDLAPTSAEIVHAEEIVKRSMDALKDS